jgi:hypothetical protein
MKISFILPSRNNKIENIRKKMESSIDNFVLDVVKSL